MSRSFYGHPYDTAASAAAAASASRSLRSTSVLSPTESVVAQEKAEKITRNNWYSDEQIREILLRSLGEDTNIAPAIEIANHFLFSEILETKIQQTLEGGITTVIPVHLNGNHWAGMVIKRSDNGLQIIYNDPLGKPMPEPEWIVEQITGIVHSLTEGVVVPTPIDLMKKQQKNDDDCGPFTVDNLLRLAREDTSGKEAEAMSSLLHDEGSAVNLRRDHCEILGQSETIPDTVNPATFGSGMGADIQKPDSDITEGEKFFEKVIKIRNNGLKEIEKLALKGKNLVLVIGSTGSGKTSLLHYLTSGVKAIEKNGELVVEAIDESKGKIGHSETESETFIPSCFEEYDNIFVDLPGFGDSRSAEIDIASAYFRKEIAESAKRIKVVIVASQSDLRAGRAIFLKNTISILAKFINIKEGAKSEDYVSLVITKKPMEEDIEELKEHLAMKKSYLATLEVGSGEYKMTNEEIDKLKTKIGLAKSKRNSFPDEFKASYLNKLFENPSPAETKIIEQISRNIGIFHAPKIFVEKMGEQDKTKIFEMISSTNFLESSNYKTKVFASKDAQLGSEDKRDKAAEKLEACLEDAITSALIKKYFMKVIENASVGTGLGKIDKINTIARELENADSSSFLRDSESLSRYLNDSDQAEYGVLCKNIKRYLEVLEFFNEVHELPDGERYKNPALISSIQELDGLCSMAKFVLTIKKLYIGKEEALLMYKDVQSNFSTELDVLQSLYDYYKDAVDRSAGIGSETRLSHTDNFNNAFKKYLGPDETPPGFELKLSKMGLVFFKNAIEDFKTFFEPHYEHRDVKLKITGYVVSSSKITSIFKECKEKEKHIESIEVIAKHKFYIDMPDLTFEGVNLGIYASIWYFEQEVELKINLKGRDAQAHPAKKASSSVDGLPGKSGETGGSFSGVCLKIAGCKPKISIDVSGGNGADGQDGGDGEKGKDGITVDKSDILDKGGKSIKADVKPDYLVVIEPSYNLRSITYNKGMHESYCKVGEKPEDGKNAGRGGAKGVGGEEGDVRLSTIFTEVEEISSVRLKGADGKDGAAGKAGKAGKDGAALYLEYFRSSNEKPSKTELSDSLKELFQIHKDELGMNVIIKLAISKTIRDCGVESVKKSDGVFIPSLGIVVGVVGNVVKFAPAVVPVVMGYAELTGTVVYAVGVGAMGIVGGAIGLVGVFLGLELAGSIDRYWNSGVQHLKEIKFTAKDGSVPEVVNKHGQIVPKSPAILDSPSNEESKLIDSCCAEELELLGVYGDAHSTSDS
jgi:energy-coupling factor transporter ATP-binding protein EcfA2